MIFKSIEELKAKVGSLNGGRSYEEQNWAKLSPEARNAHNKLRKLRGLDPIPDPKKDLYVKPRAPKVKAYNFDDPEFKAATRQFLGGNMVPGDEGFRIKK